MCLRHTISPAAVRWTVVGIARKRKKILKKLSKYWNAVRMLRHVCQHLLRKFLATNAVRKFCTAEFRNESSFRSASCRRKIKTWKSVDEEEVFLELRRKENLVCVQMRAVVQVKLKMKNLIHTWIGLLFNVEALSTSTIHPTKSCNANWDSPWFTHVSRCDWNSQHSLKMWIPVFLLESHWRTPYTFRCSTHQRNFDCLHLDIHVI